MSPGLFFGKDNLVHKASFAFFRHLTALGIITLLAFSITPYIPLSVRLTDLPSHFVLQYAMAAVIGAVIVLLLKMPRVYLGMLGAAFALNMVTLVPYLPRGQTVITADLATFKILQVNTLFLNRNTKPLETLIRAESPDIITAVETNDAFAKMFKTLSDIYPYQDIYPRKDAHGLAVLSRFPLDEKAIGLYAEPATPAQSFTVTLHGQKIRFLSMHPYTPTGNLKKRDAHIFAVAEAYAAPQDTPLIITGDFNATPWSPVMKKFIGTTNLRHARRGFGLLPSWPVFLPASFLRIPIDHIFVDKRLMVLDYRLGGPIGSDHLPTIGTFSFAATQHADK